MSLCVYQKSKSIEILFVGYTLIDVCRNWRLTPYTENCFSLCVHLMNLGFVLHNSSSFTEHYVSRLPVLSAFLCSLLTFVVDACWFTLFFLLKQCLLCKAYCSFNSYYSRIGNESCSGVRHSTQNNENIFLL